VECEYLGSIHRYTGAGYPDVQYPRHFNRVCAPSGAYWMPQFREDEPGTHSHPCLLPQILWSGPLRTNTTWRRDHLLHNQSGSIHSTQLILEVSMPCYLELRDGHSGLDSPSSTPGVLGPLLGPFIGIRLLRDEVRVITKEREIALQRVGVDWVFYAGKYYSDIEIVPTEQMGTARNRRRQPFDLRLPNL